MNKPNFFIVGQPKTGTTTLYKVLKEHPDIFMVESKEPCYFCKDFWRNATSQHKFHEHLPRTEAEYLELYTNTKQEKIVGEASSRYLYSKVAAQEIYNFNPASKIIIMLREPVDFLQSYHAQMVRNVNYNYETVRNFSKALFLEEKRKNGHMLPKDCLVSDFFYYYEYIKYTEQIKRYYDYFPKNQIKIILYDEFKSDIQTVLKDTFNFLDVDKEYQFKIKRYNKGKSINSKKVQLFLYKITSEKPGYCAIKKIYRLISTEKVRKIISQQLINRMLFKPLEKLNNKEMQNLKKQYKSEVIKLSNFLQRNLVDLWGYDLTD